MGDGASAPMINVIVSSHDIRIKEGRVYVIGLMDVVQLLAYRSRKETSLEYCLIDMMWNLEMMRRTSGSVMI
jgi:hypothetical protein